MKMTFQPKKRQRSKVHGFRARMKTAGGRKVLASRRAKGRKVLSAQAACMWPFLLSKWRQPINMKYSVSLRNNRDFQYIYKNGTSCANKYLVMYIKENGTNQNRLGISVSKKVGNSVVRHRLTRLIRESYRLQKETFRCGLDMIVVARVAAKDKSYREIESALLHLGHLHKIKISS